MDKKPRLYLDCNATMPLKPQVIAAMTGVMAEPGNASSTHGFGRAARSHVEAAREAVAMLAGTDPAYVFFTSGATESNNTVMKTFGGQRVFISAIEHSSILESAANAQLIPVTQDGVVDLAALEAMLTAKPAPALVSVMLVNNETGVIQPVAEIVRLVRRLSPQTAVHTDAVQAAGRIDLDFAALQADFMSLSAHKVGGPQGAGALIMAPGTTIEKLLKGGGQEKRQRAGTENDAAITGFGVAARLAVQEKSAFQGLAELRDALERRVTTLEPRVRIFGAGASRVANTTQLSLPGIPAETQLMALDLEGIAVSSGSACSSGTVRPSHVLKAMGISDMDSLGALRISFGWQNTAEDVARFMRAWTKMHARLKDKIAA